MRIAPVVEVTAEEKAWLLKQSRSQVAPRRLGGRCRIILLAAEGKTNEQIGAALGISRQKAGRWRTRFVGSGRAGIEADRPGRGRKPTYSAEVRDFIIRKTTRATPPD